MPIVGIVIAFFIGLATWLGNLLISLLSAVTLGVSIVLSRFALRIIVAVLFYGFVVSKTSEFFNNFASLNLPPAVTSILCVTGIGQGFNLILSAFFVAIALRAVRRTVLGGD